MQRQQIVLIDDVDGGPADETITFALDGVSYEIDLSTKNAAALRDAFAVWTASGRRQAGARRQPARRASSASSPRSDLNDVRAWGRENGFEVSDRGRVSSKLQEAYDRAH